MRRAIARGDAMSAREYNFDGLIGPTHNYAGLSRGNIASARHAQMRSRPKHAALQGLEKMRFMMGLGLGQGILLPHLRPHLPTLYALGFRGSPEQMIAAAHRADPQLVRWVSSASAMWAANAATVSPSADTADGRVHFSVANLATMPHRALESHFTEQLLLQMFSDPEHFVIHSPMPGGVYMGDEGAANHGRLAPYHGAAGVEIFVYGGASVGRFPARQTRNASQAVARRHGVLSEKTLFVQQSRHAIGAGAFHNDVVSVTNGGVLFTHAHSFEDQAGTYAQLRTLYPDLMVIEATDVSLEDAIASYLFNSQLVTLPEGSMALILPTECAETPSVHRYLQNLLTQNTPIQHTHFINVRESMRNGGGPACLRLRVVLRDDEAQALDPRFVLNDARAMQLQAWIERTYPDEIDPEDMQDAALHRQCLSALDDLTALLGLGSLYAFQT